MPDVIKPLFAPAPTTLGPEPTPPLAAPAAPLNENVAGPVTHTGVHDPLYGSALRAVGQTPLVSVSHLQSRLRVGYRRTAWMIKAMELAERAATPCRSARRLVPATCVLEGFPASPLRANGLLEGVPGPADAPGNCTSPRRSPQWWLTPEDVDFGCTLLELHNALERDLITYLPPANWAQSQRWHADPLLAATEGIQLAPIRPQHLNKIRSVIIEWFSLEAEFLEHVGGTRAGRMTPAVFYRWFASLRNELWKCGQVRSQGRALLERVLELAEGMVTHIDCVRDAVLLLPELARPSSGQHAARLARSLRWGMTERFGLSVATLWYLELMCSQTQRRVGADFQRLYGLTDALWRTAMDKAVANRAIDPQPGEP
jgi:hypothetical protein